MDIIGYHTAAVFILILIAAVILDGGINSIYLKSAVIIGFGAVLAYLYIVYLDIVRTARGTYKLHDKIYGISFNKSVFLHKIAYLRVHILIHAVILSVLCYRYCKYLHYDSRHKSEYDYGNENLCQRKAFFTFKAFKQLHAIRSFHQL
jgi:hypothetical protein